jgi:hypothetical protein
LSDGKYNLRLKIIISKMDDRYFIHIIGIFFIYYFTSFNFIISFLLGGYITSKYSLENIFLDGEKEIIDLVKLIYLYSKDYFTKEKIKI